MRFILISIDGSPGADAAVADGLELARDAGARVLFVTVRPTISILGAPYAQEKLSGQMTFARQAVDGASARAAESGLEAESEILERDPAEQVLGVARSRDVDLVAVGSRGRAGVSAALLGSVSRAIANGADRPVLVVKKPEEVHGR
jgi:nucleotide-binding universal stress UspA family protein